MGYIKEPDGVVFHVINKKLTKQQQEMITEFIANSKKNKVSVKKPKKALN